MSCGRSVGSHHAIAAKLIMEFSSCAALLGVRVRQFCPWREARRLFRRSCDLIVTASSVSDRRRFQIADAHQQKKCHVAHAS